MNKKKNRRIRLWLYFSAIIFFTLIDFALVMLALWFVFYFLGIATLNPLDFHMPIFMILTTSLLIGGFVSLAIGKLLIRPINQLGTAFEELSKGNFDVKMPTDGKLSDIRDIAERFNAMAYELSHVETLRTDFVSNISHEFKTPISAIEGYVTLLQNPELSKEKHDYYVEKILTNTHRLTTLSSNILALSKLENQQMVLHKKKYMLDEQLRKAVLLLEEKWTAKNLDFDIELEQQPFYGDENLLEQVWFNLLDNAIKHSPENGTITVSISSDSHAVTVSVTDCGEGMSEETKKHIFEKFYQGDSSHKAEGNGLGLALVKRIIELCHGEIEVTSELGKGTVFEVTLAREE